MQFIPQNNVYVYFRYNDDEKVMVVINNSPKEQALDLNRFSEMLKYVSIGKDIISNKDIVLNDKLIIEAKASMVIELQ